MEDSSIPAHTYSSSMVMLLLSILFKMIDGLRGLSESLFERLTSSPAEPFLRTLQDLFVNFMGGDLMSDFDPLCSYLRIT